MCLIALAYQAHPKYRLIIAANRDEFFDRPTRAAQFWPEAPQVLAGKDLEAGGTWLGITRGGRFAAVTNYRDGDDRSSYPLSRGQLARHFLLDQRPASSYLQSLSAQTYRQTGGFNLLVGDTASLHYDGNRQAQRQRLMPGIYGLSNHLLNTPWPKVQTARTRLEALLQQSSASIDPEQLFSLLGDDRPAADRHLPETGIDHRWEKHLSSCFIRGEYYGTRSSTVVLIEHSGQALFWERSFCADGLTGEQKYTFQIEHG